MDRYLFTQHAQYKMQQYGLSEQRVRRVIRAPKRVETGIVENTVAVMQPVSEKRMPGGQMVWKQEIWTMYQIVKVTSHQSSANRVSGKDKKLHPVKLRQCLTPSGVFNRVKIISAWRYPGVSPKRDPIPEDILREISQLIGR